MTDLDAAFRLAHSMADTARSLASKYFRQIGGYDLKADSSPVTVADRDIELSLRQAIAAYFPGHGVYGEEFGAEITSDEIWVIDPIDGTKSFVTGVPLFGSLIAFVEADVARIGVVEIPVLQERWSALAGQGTTLNGTACRTSGCTRLSEARILTTSPDAYDADETLAYDRLSKAARLRRFGGDCYEYGLLASGHIDLLAEASVQPYDYMAAVPVIEGAGGVISDWEGRPLTIRSGSRFVASATRELHDQALAALNG